MSLYHHEHPFSMNVNGEDFGVGYWPGDSKSGMVCIQSSPWELGLTDISLGAIRIGVDLSGLLSTIFSLSRAYLRFLRSWHELMPARLQRFHQYYGDSFKVREPLASLDFQLMIERRSSVQQAREMYVSSCQITLSTYSGIQYMNLAEVADEIQHRLIHIFSRDEHGRRAVNGGNPKLNRDPWFREYIHFYEVGPYRVSDRMC